MKCACPYCNVFYQEVDDSLLNQEVECASCKRIFIAEPYIEQSYNTSTANQQKSHPEKKQNYPKKETNHYDKEKHEVTTDFSKSLRIAALFIGILSAIIFCFGFLTGAIWYFSNGELKEYQIAFCGSVLLISTLGIFLFVLPFYALSKIIQLLEQIEANTRK